MAEERTAEEREAARREREARRRASGGPEGSDGGDGGGPVWPLRTTTAPRARRVPRTPRSSRAPRRGPPQPGSARPHPRRNRIAAFGALVVAALVVWLCVEIFQPFHGSGHGSATVVIPPHSGVSAVADRLARAGVIDSSFFFELRATLDGDRSDLRAGTYHLKLGMSYGAVLKILTTPPPPAPVTEVTITPGHTRRQIDALLRAQGVKGSYLAETRSSPLLNPLSYGAPKRTSSLEGFLFPDTYQLRKPISISALVADQLQDFKRRFAGINLSYARSKHLSAYDVLIVASMVEGESPNPSDLPKIASVIYNRLRDGIPLQMDSTVRFATDNYTSPITQQQLHSRSPWNTYTHSGLPPTPIDSPSLASIEAAAHPAHTNYLYFVAKPCGNGASLFASSYRQFQAEEQSYNAARARRGGKSPVKC
jgi:UPF0755 protein